MAGGTISNLMHAILSSAKVGVIVVTWNSEKFIPTLIESLKKVNYPADSWRIFFVDNGSEDGTTEKLRSYCHSRESGNPDKKQTEFFLFVSGSPIGSGMTEGDSGRTGVEIICNNKNLGFARASNQGADEAVKWGAEYLYFLNPDTEVDKDFLNEALEVFEADQTVGQVQSLTLRESGKEIQSRGNCLTFLGFGYSGGDGCPVETSRDLSVQDIGYASGAAMMVPTKIWKEVGGFDEIYESFHEDTDLSLRIRLAGYRIVIASNSRVIHKYQFARSIKNYYYMERNRYILGLKFFKMPTLLLFLPAFIIMEAGTLGFSFWSGFWKEKLKAYVWLILYLEKVWARRIVLQRSRKMGDRELAKYMVAKVEFQEVMNPILYYIVNPVMEVYWKIIKRVIVW